MKNSGKDRKPGKIRTFFRWILVGGVMAGGITASGFAIAEAIELKAANAEIAEKTATIVEMDGTWKDWGAHLCDDYQNGSKKLGQIILELDQYQKKALPYLLEGFGEKYYFYVGQGEFEEEDFDLDLKLFPEEYQEHILKGYNAAKQQAGDNSNPGSKPEPPAPVEPAPPQDDDKNHTGDFGAGGGSTNVGGSSFTAEREQGGVKFYYENDICTKAVYGAFELDIKDGKIVSVSAAENNNSAIKITVAVEENGQCGNITTAGASLNNDAKLQLQNVIDIVNAALNGGKTEKPNEDVAGEQPTGGKKFNIIFGYLPEENER